MEDPISQDKHSQALWEKHEKLPHAGDIPPSPPVTEDSASDPSIENDIPLPPQTTEPTEVLAVDKNTPDFHVPRDPRLIRLTGVHPFNVEPPLTTLFNEGFLTSPELFYVRNHGAVPQVREEEVPEWEFTVEGSVQYLIPSSVPSLYL